MNMIRKILPFVLINFVLVATVSAQILGWRDKQEEELQEQASAFLAPSPMICGDINTISKVIEKHNLSFTSFYGKSEIADTRATVMFYFSEKSKKFMIVRVYVEAKMHCIIEFGTQITTPKGES